MTRNQAVFSEAVYVKKVCLILSRRIEFVLESIYIVGRVGETTPQTTRPSFSEYSVPEIDFRYTESLSSSCPWAMVFFVILNNVFSVLPYSSTT